MNRVETLHRGKQINENISFDLQSIYNSNEYLDIEGIPFRLPMQHTMFNALDLYCEQKLPVDDIRQACGQGSRLEVHGIYPKHFELVYSEKNRSSQLIEINFYHKPTTRKYNLVRPRFFRDLSNGNFIVALAPGSDYIKHYGTMIRHFCMRNGLDHELILCYYPLAFHSLPIWTYLNTGFIKPGDIVLIGYAQEIYEALDSTLGLIPVNTSANPYLESRRFKFSSEKYLNILGVNFSFWGNLSQILIEEICRSGAAEIIYVGKLGSLVNAQSLYKNIFSPTSYVTLNHKNIVNSVNDLKNGLVKMFPDLDTQLHVSVPTVLEEDYEQRAVASKLNANSIDNEISQIAYTISKFNLRNRKDVHFSALHFATDYVRMQSEKYLETSHDLSTNRLEFTVNKKEIVIKKCTDYLIKYLESKN